mmetsp:Transcript_10953/g.44814  ORF Transcript_10953/g.44814 Transcript_10953/m.44814 type:complete len:430 (-) Transcript_10953:29-1318(-)
MGEAGDLLAELGEDVLAWIRALLRVEGASRGVLCQCGVADLAWRHAVARRREILLCSAVVRRRILVYLCGAFEDLQRRADGRVESLELRDELTEIEARLELLHGVLLGIAAVGVAQAAGDGGMHLGKHREHPAVGLEALAEVAVQLQQADVAVVVRVHVVEQRKELLVRHVAVVEVRSELLKRQASVVILVGTGENVGEEAVALVGRGRVVDVLLGPRRIVGSGVGEYAGGRRRIVHKSGRRRGGGRRRKGESDGNSARALEGEFVEVLHCAGDSIAVGRRIEALQLHGSEGNAAGVRLRDVHEGEVSALFLPLCRFRSLRLRFLSAPSPFFALCLCFCVGAASLARCLRRFFRTLLLSCFLCSRGRVLLLLRRLVGCCLDALVHGRLRHTLLDGWLTHHNAVQTLTTHRKSSSAPLQLFLSLSVSRCE